MLYSQMSKEQLQAEKTALEKQYADYKAKGLKLDMSRGKPAPEQLNLSLDMLLHCLDGDYKSSNGIDCRNYGVLDGIPQAAWRTRQREALVQIRACEVPLPGSRL